MAKQKGEITRLKCFVHIAINLYMTTRYYTNSYCFSRHTAASPSNSVRYSLVVKDLSESPDLKDFLYGIIADNHQYLYGVQKIFQQKNTPVLEDEGDLNVFTTE